jgi:hypothetical protein
MSDFVYLITEGVTDVTLITRVLVQYFSLRQVRRREDLPGWAKSWLDGFKWPVRGDISRLGVPAPVFLQGDGLIVGIRNAQGLGGMNDTLEADEESFLRSRRHPAAMGVLVDADHKPPHERFTRIRDGMKTGDGLPLLAGLVAPGEVETTGDAVRRGVFVFPDAETSGTIEDTLSSLGEAAFPLLHAASHGFVSDWTEQHGREPLFSELNKPAGESKARLSAMVALLKPAKNLNASLQDQPWVPEGDPPDALMPLTRFLEALLGVR